MIHYETKLKVRSYECDLYGHVNNATFLNYCEFARVEFLQDLGFTLDFLKSKGILLPIVKIEIEFKKSLYPGQSISISVDWLNRGRSSARLQQEIKNDKDDQPVARAEITFVVTDLQGKSIPVPQEMLDAVYKRYGQLPPQNEQNRNRHA